MPKSLRQSGCKHLAARLHGTKKAPEKLSGAFDFELIQLIALMAIGHSNQKFTYVVRLEPSVSPDADAVTREQTRIRPTAHRMGVGIKKMGNLGHCQQASAITRCMKAIPAGFDFKSYHQFPKGPVSNLT